MKTQLLSLLMLASCAAPKVQEKVSQISSYESDGNGFNTKNFFYDNGKEVVVFDTQFTEKFAEESVKLIQSQTKSPIKYVVVTHPNPDKFNGMSVFQKLGAKVIASNLTAQSMPEVHGYKKYFFVNMAKMFTEETYPALSKPDIIFSGAYSLTLSNGEKINLVELGKAGVSSNQTVAHIPSKNALFVGDLVHHKAHAWFEGGIVKGVPKPDITSWINVLKEVEAEFPAETVVYGGRGESAKLGEAVQAQVEYLKQVDAIVTKQVKKAGKGDSQYEVIQGLAEKAYPEYKLGYMIKYGVYGLVNSKK